MSILDNTDRWPPDSQKCVFLGRALKEISADDAWEGLRSGALEIRVYCVGRTDFAPIPLSPLKFFGADRSQVFDTCQIELIDSDTRRPVAIRRRIPVPHWIYVTRESVEKLLRPVSNVRNETDAIEHLAERRRRRRRAALQCFAISARSFVKSKAAEITARRLAHGRNTSVFPPKLCFLVSPPGLTEWRCNHERKNPRPAIRKGRQPLSKTRTTGAGSRGSAP